MLNIFKAYFEDSYSVAKIDKGCREFTFRLYPSVCL